MQKNLFIKTYGCQMNVYDSIKMADLLKPFGYQMTNEPDDADMVVLNTCHIREKATEKVYSELGRIKKIKNTRKKNNQETVIVVAGCVGQAEGEEIFKRSPWVDVVVGPQSYQNLPELIAKLSREKKHVINLDFEEIEKFDKLEQEALTSSQNIAAFVAIQEGCDKFCKFCCVPYTRGAEFSRPLEQIYREVSRLGATGSKEITLLGQNVNAYHGLCPNGNEVDLANLIEHLSQISSIRRIRYMTSHPIDMSKSLIEAHGKYPKLMPFLHLPIQSGSDKILKEMNRKHSAEFYLEIISQLRKIRPDMAFSSDFIVGYPGETEKDFEDTLELVKKVGYAQCYSFKYSPRPGTPASILPQIPEEVKDARLAKLQQLLAKQQDAFNESFIGKEFEILIEKIGKKPGQLAGKSPYLQMVHIDSSEGIKIGDEVKVRVKEALSHTLLAEVIA